ncbi:hypothetical protein DERF_004480, partial [Dermatophagoides farinae]
MKSILKNNQLDNFDGSKEQKQQQQQQQRKKQKQQQQQQQRIKANQNGEKKMVLFLQDKKLEIFRNNLNHYDDAPYRANNDDNNVHGDKLFGIMKQQRQHLCKLA